jgi:DNA-binding MarR family transcriptional regulator
MSTLNLKERRVQEVIAELRNLDGELDLMDQAIADRLGVNRTDAQCMDIITRSGPISAGDLAERVGLTAGAITTVLDRLERGHWIRREHDTVDRRRVMVCPNKSEGHTIHPVFSGLVGNTRKLLERYSSDELQLIGDFLRRAAAVAAEHRHHLRGLAVGKDRSHEHRHPNGWA